MVTIPKTACRRCWKKPLASSTPTQRPWESPGAGGKTMFLVSRPGCSTLICLQAKLPTACLNGVLGPIMKQGLKVIPEMRVALPGFVRASCTDDGCMRKKTFGIYLPRT